MSITFLLILNFSSCCLFHKHLRFFLLFLVLFATVENRFQLESTTMCVCGRFLCRSEARLRQTGLTEYRAISESWADKLTDTNAKNDSEGLQAD